MLAIVNRRWRQQLHHDIYTADDADMMERVKNCIYRLKPGHDTQMAYMTHIIMYIKKSGEFSYNNAKTIAAKLHSGDQLPIWIIMRTATPNEGDITEDMNTDYEEYTEDEDEEYDDKEIDKAMKNNWQDLSWRNMRGHNMIRCPMY
ncbi:hypothetical protein AMTR_s00054p00051240 [Amborella trichopoda]|uniref:Uncharacterized protein n=1 Tax=Amborella trichopoda TaxID=13333 RepID=U5CXS9_AMBTC|nr:hypothetical protein AMTR_s00054p00051240 [Amborella trichopoda]